jgi:hypothetical protein
MFARRPGGRFLYRFLHPGRLQRYRTIMAANFFPSIDQVKQAIETVSSDSKI